MPLDLYEHDIATWSEQQSALIRRLASGERVNGIDWENVAEEIESVGRSEVRAVASLLEQSILHAIKLLRWPEHPAAAGWHNEISNFLIQASAHFEPAMARRIEVEKLLARAIRHAESLRMGSHPALDIPPLTAFDPQVFLDGPLSPESLIEALTSG